MDDRFSGFRPHDVGQREQCPRFAGADQDHDAPALRLELTQTRIAYGPAQPCEISRADDADLLAFHDGDDAFARDITDAGRTRNSDAPLLCGGHDALCDRMFGLAFGGHGEAQLLRLISTRHPREVTPAEHGY